MTVSEDMTISKKSITSFLASSAALLKRSAHRAQRSSNEVLPNL